MRSTIISLISKYKQKVFEANRKSLIPSSSSWLEGETATVCPQMIRYWSTSHVCHFDYWTCDEGPNR